VYDGEWKDDKRHGHGVYKSPDEVLYYFLLNPENTKYIVSNSTDTGILADIKRSCLKMALGLSIHNPIFGVECLTHDETYTGEFDNDRFHGYGVLTRTSDGSILYDGHWHSNEPHGAANFIKTQGGQFSGDMFFGKADGHGTAAVPEGVYTGQMKNGQAEGIGSMTFINGDVYTGEFSGGKINGTGAIKLHNGMSYEGEWRDGARHGQGVLNVGDRVMYTGSWVDDGMFGNGVLYNYESKSFFMGEIGVNGPQTGHIVVECENGIKLSMEMENYTRKVGPTVVILPDGSQFSLNAHQDANPKFTEDAVYFGSFSPERLFSGCAFMRLENGDIYAGDIVNDKANGHGVAKYANGTEYEGEWKDNNQHGKGVLRGSDGVVIRDGMWENDEPVE
jgi:hypothetical protein